MGRRRQYPSDADRQHAYRERLRTGLATGNRGEKPAVSPRLPSRPLRLSTAEDEIRKLLQEYENWLESLPEALASSAQAAKLAEVIEQLGAVVDTLAEIEPPRGFGRD